MQDAGKYNLMNDLWLHQVVTYLFPHKKNKKYTKIKLVIRMLSFLSIHC